MEKALNTIKENVCWTFHKKTQWYRNIYIAAFFFLSFFFVFFFISVLKKHKKFIVGIYQFFIHSLSFEIDLSSYRFLNLVETFTFSWTFSFPSLLSSRLTMDTLDQTSAIELSSDVGVLGSEQSPLFYTISDSYYVQVGQQIVALYRKALLLLQRSWKSTLLRAYVIPICFCVVMVSILNSLLLRNILSY